MDNDLDKAFNDAYSYACKSKIKLAPDKMLHLYAYYKQATKGNNYEQPTGNVQLRNAFKINAWLQLKNVSEEQAKREYIKLVNKYLK